MSTGSRLPPIRCVAGALLLCSIACAPSVSPYLDLVKRVADAESLSSTRFIDLGTAAGRSHLGKGWSKQDERWVRRWSFVWATGTAATLYFYTLAKDVRAVRIRCAPPPSLQSNGVRQALTLLLNPSITSLMTGLLPPSHDVYGRHDKLSADAATLPELLHAHGYETFGVITNAIVSPAFGFDQGWDRYVYLRERSDERIHRYSDEVNAVFLEWLDQRDEGRPFFAYLHTMDVHSPYTPPEPFKSRFAPDQPRTGLRFPREARPFAKGHPEFTEQQVRDDLVALYDGEIAHNDQRFGELLNALRDRGLYDDLVIVLLSDHGEEFLEHGDYEHLKTLYRELVHVPLMVKLPQALNGGMRTEATAQHADLMPTLLQMVGAEIPEWIQGESLLPVLEDPRRERRSRTVRSYLQVDDASVASFIDGNWHLLRSPMTWESIRILGLELYDLDGDPGETRNLAQESWIRAGLLLTRWQRAEAQDLPILASERGTIDEVLRERLRALGYLR